MSITKKILNIIIKVSAEIISWFLHPKITHIIKESIDTVYTRYIEKQIFQCGRCLSIEFPCVFLGKERIKFGDNLNVLARTRIEAITEHLGNRYTPEIVIGNDVWINYDCHIGCVNKITIGNNCVIASKVFITDHSHGEITSEAIKLPPGLRKVTSKGPVEISDNVWIGEGVCVLPNVKIGKNVIVGANSVVTRDVPDNAVIAGNPAKVIKIL